MNFTPLQSHPQSQLLPLSLLAPAPTRSPASGVTAVIPTGSSLTGATGCKLGAAGGTSFVVNSATQITAPAPAGSSVVDVTVTTPGGTSATGAGDQYTYIAAPTVSSVSPTGGSTAGSTSVTIAGTNLTGATAVKFGGTNATAYVVNGPTQITATAPAGSAGTVDISVTTAGGTTAASPNDHYTYFAIPTLSSIPPTSWPP